MSRRVAVAFSGWGIASSNLAAAASYQGGSATEWCARAGERYEWYSCVYLFFFTVLAALLFIGAAVMPKAFRWLDDLADDDDDGDDDEDDDEDDDDLKQGFDFPFPTVQTARGLTPPFASLGPPGRR
ncbi:hypothetical protein MAPG_07295 [Magnaporthiopsis poae ATCC 64411]|uniref:Uncharacterized protein n=1 Tax=Magnaporthiopsis poae (strain ATCC 64411 / 73-15) TaxID=644358 RepID=A0A0C4E4A4_MAGP6|nr:hypothetical protein MAPG_07295 [Magnaporthiopsis poae ATCC 64411]